jgi:thiosulfate/3-mercaptopyruvate sulfurtransferase
MRLIAVLTFLFVLAGPARALDVPAPIVDAAWLKDRLGTPGLVVVEMSTDVAFEFDGHIPGAVPSTRSDWRYQADDKAVVRRSIDEIEAAIKALGVNDGDAVVIYAKGNTLHEVLASAYLYWLFNLLGHENVALLDEGWTGWLKADGEISSDVPDIEPGTFTARYQAELETSTDAVLAAYKNGFKDAPLIDGRPAGHFRGETKFPANIKYGRIPGAVNQPWPDYIAESEDGLLYMKSEMPKLLADGSLKPEQPLVLTCFGGTGSSMNFVLFRHHGYKNTTVHDDGVFRWNLRDLPLTKD